MTNLFRVSADDLVPVSRTKLTSEDELEGWIALTHRPTGFFCMFGAHTVTTSPGHNKKVEDSRHEDIWLNKENACGKWLVIVKSEVDAPDLWATIGQEKALSTAASSASLDNRPFTAAELKVISTKLDEIKACCWKVSSSPSRKPRRLSGNSHI